MRSFYYRPGKNAGIAVFLGGLGVVFGGISWSGGGGIIMWGLTAMLLAGAVKGALNALDGDPALKFDHDRLWVRTTFGGLQEVPWRDVHRISLEVMVMRYFGLIPLGRTEFLCIATGGGPLGTRRFRLSAGSMELPAGGAAGLVHLLNQAQLEAEGAPGAGPAGAAGHDSGAAPSREPDAEPGTGFDPDAAVARYLASKQAAQRDTPSGLGPRPMPQRAVFGRRAT